MFKIQLHRNSSKHYFKLIKLFLFVHQNTKRWYRMKGFLRAPFIKPPPISTDISLILLFSSYWHCQFKYLFYNFKIDTHRHIRKETKFTRLEDQSHFLTMFWPSLISFNLKLGLNYILHLYPNIFFYLER